MKSLFKKIFNYFLIFLISFVCLFIFIFMLLNPLSLGSIVGMELILAGQPSGSSVSVPLNPINKIAMQLDEKEKELNKKEKDLAIIEKQIIEKNSVLYGKFIFVVLFVVLFLLSLILLNFYFDYKRQKKAKNELLNN